MQWFTVNLLDSETGKQLITHERGTTQLDAEINAQERDDVDEAGLLVIGTWQTGFDPLA